MDITIINPIGATPDIAASSMLRPAAPPTPPSTDTLREVNIVELGAAIADMGHRVTIIMGGPFLGNRSWSLAPNLSVVPMHTLMPFPFHPGVLPMTPEVMHLPAVCDADVIQSGEFHQPSTFFAAKASLERGIPLVVWQETFLPMRFPVSLYQRWFEQTVGRKVRAAASRCVPRTSKARQYLESLGIPEDAIPAWIPTGVDVTRFVPRASTLSPADFGWDERCLVLLLVARLHPDKGVDDALRLLARLLKTQTDVRLLVRGSGPQEAELKRLAQELGIPEFVRFLPRRSRAEMVELYNLASVVLSTSRADLLPFSLMEASACGRPVVARDVGAVTDIVVDGQTGRVVSPGDFAQLADCVANLLDDGAKRAAFGRASRERAERHFDLRITARRLVEVYDDVAQ